MAEGFFTPTKSLTLSFAATILVGAILLTLDISANHGKSTSFVDALFTSTSAVCVTGLVVVDTGTHFSRFGQAIIVILIQLGGLGIMTFSVFLGIVVGMGVGLFERQIVKDSFGTQYSGKVGGLVLRIFLLVFIVEGIGAALLAFRWKDTAKSVSEAIWLGVFHSVSAFCNAGFSTFSNNLEGFREDFLVNIVIMLLIVIGGLGFVALFEIIRKASAPKKKQPLSLHTKTVLVTTGLLIFGGATLIYLLEAFGLFKGYSSTDGFMSALFQSVTARTAGFNTVPIGPLSNATLTIIIILMFVGASPGGTGGGIKTTTAAVFFADFRSYLLGREPEMYERSIDRETVEKAYLVIILALGMTTIISFILMVFERNVDAIKLVFEAVSAFGTVGLSTGITPELSAPSKLALVLLMFAGRIGPLTLALAFGGKNLRGSFRYPEGKIFLG